MKTYRYAASKVVIKKVKFMSQRRALSQMKQLLWYLQQFQFIVISSLRAEGFKGADGKRCKPQNPPATILGLRRNGWVIETVRELKSAYRLLGHYDSFPSDQQAWFVKKKWVAPMPHLSQIR